MPRETDYGTEINGWRRDSARLDWLLALASNTDFEVGDKIVTDLDRAKIDALMAEFPTPLATSERTEETMPDFEGDGRFWHVTDPTPIGPVDSDEYVPLELPRIPPTVPCGGCDGEGCDDCEWLGYFTAYPDDYPPD